MAQLEELASKRRNLCLCLDLHLARQKLHVQCDFGHKENDKCSWNSGILWQKQKDAFDISFLPGRPGNEKQF